MDRKNFYASLYSAALLLLTVPVSLCITSCSDAITESENEDGEDEVQFNVSYNDVTRVVTTPVDGINTFYIHAYQGTMRKANNIKYVYVSNKWKASGLGLTWPKSDPINIFGLTDSYKTVLNDNMTASRSIDYYIPPIGAHDVWYASAIGQLKAKTGGTVNLKFARLVSRVNLSCKNSMKNFAVKISEVIIHNIVSAGTFTFSEKSASVGTWKLLNTGENPYYADYPQKLKVALDPGIVRDDELPVILPQESSKLITDSAFILIPQKTVKWTPDNTTTPKKDTLYANANHQCYIEVKCQIFSTDTNGNFTLDDCVWGDVTGVDDDAKFKSIFVPFLKTWSKNNNIQNLTFDLSDAYNADGTNWEPETGQIQFDEGMLLTPIEDDSGNVDLWDEGETDDSDAIPVEL